MVDEHEENLLMFIQSSCSSGESKIYVNGADTDLDLRRDLGIPPR